MKIANIELFDNEAMSLINQQPYIGIRLSGGIDSAVLCYIVLKYFPHIKILPITFYNKLRPNAVNSVNNVLSTLKELNPGNKLMPQEIGYFDSTGYVKLPNSKPKSNPKDVFQRKFINHIFYKHRGRLNLILSGVTLNPPVEDQISLGVEDEFPQDRNQTTENTIMEYTHRGYKKYEYRPFRNSNKKEVADVCRELGLFETLFPYTESCETEPEKYKYYQARHNIEYSSPGVEPCQGCWPCREKYWAYGVFDFNTKKRVEI